MNDKLAQWTYIIPSYTATLLTKSREDILKEPEQKEKEDETPAPIADVTTITDNTNHTDQVDLLNPADK